MPPLDLVADDELLWRRLHAENWIVTVDGVRRVSSAAFRNTPDEDGDISLSAHIASMTTQEEVLAILPRCIAIAEILTAYPRSLGHEILHTPTPEVPSHASIIPPRGIGGSKKKTDAKKMALEARLIEFPRL
jgi:hypothetical protein